MQNIQEEQQFISRLHENYQAKKYELRNNQRELSDLQLHVNELNNDKEATLRASLEHLQEVKGKYLKKVHQLNQFHQQFQRKFEMLKKYQYYQPPQRPIHSQEEIAQLGFKVQNLMTFDPISSKVFRISKEFELKCNSLKENIKKVKLKLSLTEMEYKDFVNKSNRFSQKFDNDF